MTDPSGWTSPGSGSPPDPPSGWSSPGWNPPPGWGSPPPGPGWGPPPGWQSPPVARPGVVPLRPLGLGELLDGAFSIVRRNPKVTLAWSAIVLVAAQAVQIGIGLLLRDPTSSFDFAGSQSPFNGRFVARGVGSFFLSGFVNATATALLTGLLAGVVADAVLGRRTSFGDVWHRVSPRAGPLLGAAILAGCLPYLALVAFILPGMFLWGVLALVPPALVLERVSVGAAMRRSWRLALPDFWRVWSIRALAVLIALAVSAVFAIPAGVAGALAAAGSGDSGGGLPIALLVVVAVSGLLAAILTQPFVAAVVALLYVDRRMRAEALDIVLAQSAGATAPGMPGPSGLQPPSGP